jgi:hypothetical protein
MVVLLVIFFCFLLKIDFNYIDKDKISLLEKMVDVPWYNLCVHTLHTPLLSNYILDAIEKKCIIINNPLFSYPLDYYYSIEDLDITEIVIQSYKFNQSLERLPKNLKKLKLICATFNQSLDQLPTSLEYLQINSLNFNQNLLNLPNSLKVLILNCSNFNQHLDYLPIQLEIFVISSDNFTYPLNNLPVNLSYLNLRLPNYKYILSNL